MREHHSMGHMRQSGRGLLAAGLFLALLLGALIPAASADKAPDGFVWLCMFRGSACEFTNTTTTTCSLLALNGTCGKILDGGAYASVRRSASGASVGANEIISYDGFLDSACTPAFAFPLGISNVTLQQCKAIPIGFVGAFYNDCPECKNVVRRYPCNPTKCVTGLTCADNLQCGNALNWTYCSANEPEKFSKRTYCPRGWFMCDEGGMLPAGSCEASAVLCDFKVRYGNELCDEIDNYWMCIHPSGSNCAHGSQRFCRLIRNGDCLPLFPGSIAPTQTPDKKWQVRGNWDAFCGAPYFQNNTFVVDNLANGVCGHYSYDELSPALARDLVFYKEKDCVDCINDSGPDALALFEPTRARIDSANCAAQKTRAACDARDGLCMWTGLPQFACETTPTGVLVNSLSEVCFASISEKECNFLAQCEWTNGHCQPPSPGDLTRTTIVMQLNFDQPTIGNSIVDSSYMARNGAPVGLSDCNLERGVSGRGAIHFQGTDTIKFPLWDLNPPDTSTNKIVMHEFLISLWVRPDSGTPIDLSSPDGTVNQQYVIGPASPDHARAIIQRADPTDARNIHILGLSVGSNGLAVFAYSPRTPEAMVRIAEYSTATPMIDWTHISIYQQANTWSIWVNNTLVKQAVSPIPVAVLPGSIGGHEFGSYRGALDFLTVWNMERRSLTSDALSQILALLSNSANDVTCSLRYSASVPSSSSPSSTTSSPSTSSSSSSSSSFPPTASSALSSLELRSSEIRAVTSSGGVLQPLMPAVDVTFDALRNELFTYTILSGALPKGVLLDARTGRISGTPSEAGSFPVVVKMTGDEYPVCFGETVVNITVLPHAAFTAQSASLVNPTGTEDAEYESLVPITPIGGSGNYSFDVVGSLPAGLAIEARGARPVLVGKPLQQGAFSFVVRITDTYGSTALTPPYSLTIFPRIILLGEASYATSGGALSVLPFEVGGGEPLSGDRRYLYRVDPQHDSLPLGVALDASGKFVGTPKQHGNFSVVVEAVDANNASVKVLTALFVAPPLAVSSTLNSNLAIVSFQGSDLAEVTTPLFNLTGGRGPYRWELLNNPGGLALSVVGTPATHARLGGIITQAGTFNPTVRVTDLNGAVSDSTFLLKVVESSPRPGGSSRSGLDASFTVIVAILIVILLICISIGFAWVVHKRNHKKRKARYLFQQELTPEHLAVYISHMSEKPAVPTEIPRRELILPATAKLLGSGAYGEVFAGVLKNTRESKVAVKMNLPGVDNEDDLKMEAAIAAQFDHPNILRLIGVISTGDRMMVLTEVCKHGSLLNFLQRTGVNSTGPATSLTTILKIGCDVLFGLEYLESMGFVHRDIAARNVLIDERYVCKIADFGMCRRLQRASSAYQADGQQVKVPIRWMAPESICYGRWTHASDMWSFGVLVYECFTNGKIPYQDLPNEQASGLGIVTYLTSGNRLCLRDDECPPSIYESILLPCWIMDPEKRPSASVLRRKIERCIAESFVVRKAGKSTKSAGGDEEGAEEDEEGLEEELGEEEEEEEEDEEEEEEEDSYSETETFEESEASRPRLARAHPPMPRSVNPYQTTVQGGGMYNGVRPPMVHGVVPMVNIPGHGLRAQPGFLPGGGIGTNSQGYMVSGPMVGMMPQPLNSSGGSSGFQSDTTATHSNPYVQNMMLRGTPSPMVHGAPAPGMYQMRPTVPMNTFRAAQVSPGISPVPPPSQSGYVPHIPLVQMGYAPGSNPSSPPSPSQSPAHPPVQSAEAVGAMMQPQVPLHHPMQQQQQQQQPQQQHVQMYYADPRAAGYSQWVQPLSASVSIDEGEHSDQENESVL